MKITITLLLILLLLAGVATWQVSQPAFDGVLAELSVEIAPPDVALTFARTRTGQLLLVTGATGETVTGVDLSAALGGASTNPLQVFQQTGYTTLAALAADDTAQRIDVPITDLGLPLQPTYPHIAAGTNFRAHAEEVGLEDGPFLFPKLSRATGWNADVPERTRLDYEVELCAVPIDTYTTAKPARLAYILCNDMTDRWTLVKDIDLDQPMGITGFPDGKGGPGMLPLGALLVIPKDDAGFYAQLEMGLYLNNQLRQQTRAGLMIWDPHRVAAEALARCDDTFVTRQTAHQPTTTLTHCAGIPAGTLILTGTPEGVLFHLANLWYPGAYLQSGDEVVTYATYLGQLRNRIR